MGQLTNREKTVESGVTVTELAGSVSMFCMLVLTDALSEIESLSVL